MLYFFWPRAAGSVRVAGSRRVVWIRVWDYRFSAESPLAAAVRKGQKRGPTGSPIAAVGISTSSPRPGVLAALAHKLNLHPKRAPLHSPSPSYTLFVVVLLTPLLCCCAWYFQAAACCANRLCFSRSVSASSCRPSRLPAEPPATRFRFRKWGERREKRRRAHARSQIAREQDPATTRQRRGTRRQNSSREVSNTSVSSLAMFAP
ncbi:hypothetical protein VTK26DRAFT_6138 [Humicola hyalothermophila]